MNYANWGLTGTSHASQSKGVMEEVMRSGNIPIAGKMGMHHLEITITYFL